MQEKISACVLTFNEEIKIERCLKSLTWCDEIVVMDSFSTDKTLDICRKYTDQIHQHSWLGFVAMRNLTRQYASFPWILFVDADEEVSPALKAEIIATFERGTGNIVGFEFPRLVYYLGKWIRHGEWYPDVKLRLFHAEYGRSEGEEPHDKIVVNGPVRRMKAPLWHYTYSDITDQINTLNRFSSIGSQHRFIKNRRWLITDIIFRPLFRFLKGYFLKLGFLDGMHGFIIASTNSFGAFAKYAKHWELRLRHKSNYSEFPE